MTEQAAFFDHPEATVILRGGPLDGGRIHLKHWVPFIHVASGQRLYYGPNGEADTEFDDLAVYVFDGAEPA